MGLTNSAIGIKAIDFGLQIKKQSPDDKVIALAGNPNVGKSTVFNGLTGMNQHTGNWPGKTVSNAQGYCSTKNQSYVLVDIPGTYSLMAHSAEEEVARNFICFGNPDAVVVVCDATCLERNLNLVLQTMEISEKVIVCINLMDEAKRKNIKIDIEKISKRLGVPVIATMARKKESLAALMVMVDKVTDGSIPPTPFSIQYQPEIEEALAVLEPVVKKIAGEKINSRWLSLKLLEQDASLNKELNTYLGENFLESSELSEAFRNAQKILGKYELNTDKLKDKIVSCLVAEAEKICHGAVFFERKSYNLTDRKIDQFLTSKATGYPIMLALLALVFWLTITGSNYPSQVLAGGLFWIQNRLTAFFLYLNAPSWLHGILILGVYRVLAWVVSVMLPPMAIFFPLFTLLEDAGYLPRIAYNLDKTFKRCRACGKQALTMCMEYIILKKTHQERACRFFFANTINAGNVNGSVRIMHVTPQYF
ncbi:MAG: ferrous iron transporter B [Clostridia bacterium]|nr:ferrous iron transporter B [Clostridia bacterium]